MPVLRAKFRCFFIQVPAEQPLRPGVDSQLPETNSIPVLYRETVCNARSPPPPRGQSHLALCMSRLAASNTSPIPGGDVKWPISGRMSLRRHVNTPRRRSGEAPSPLPHRRQRGVMTA